MSSWNYVVTAHKPTNVTHSCVGNFTNPQELNLIIAYPSHTLLPLLLFSFVCVCVCACVFFFKFFFSLLGVGLRFVVCGQSILPAFSCWIVCITISGEHGAERNSLSEERVTGQEILDLRLLFRKCTRIEIHLLTPAGLQVSEERGRGINDFQGQAGRQMDVVRTGFCGHLQLLVFFFFGKTFRP